LTVPLADATPDPQRQIALQIIDVNLNRASEGIRVVEEYCRFVLSSGPLTTRCKALRDQLHHALVPIDRQERLLARDTPRDVGATANFASEIRPQTVGLSLRQIAVHNSERVKEALRAIEEYASPLFPDAASQVSGLRYQWYELERDCQLGRTVSQRLQDARLYVLIDGAGSEAEFSQRAGLLIDAGVDIVQLRDKRLDDRTLLARARLLRRLTNNHSPLTTHHSPLLIINDRPEIAVLSAADGVHVGQEELPVRDVRRIVGSDMLIGVSTHNIEQARQAVSDGADYLGCGPTFPSQTKHFDTFPGLDFLRQVAAEIALPAFAIGGITPNNVVDVLATGFTRVAVRSAFAGAEDVRRKVSTFRTAFINTS
jgi:thiamine-phosphate pyrophosphorylase